MTLPFVFHPGRLPVIVLRPKVRKRKLPDGSLIYEAYKVRYLDLRSDRALFDIGFMLDVQQFAKLTAAERFTIIALQRRLTFSDKLTFPDLTDTGQLLPVEGSDGKFVWATIPETVIVTSAFTIFDLHDQGMALDRPEALREVIEHAIQGCPQANIDEIMACFCDFKSPHRSDISRALNKLPRLGVLRDLIKLDRYRRRAVFNMRMVATTRSGILRGMITAEDHLRRIDGTEVTFSTDLSAAEPPVERVNVASTGRRRKLTRAQYQSKYHSEDEKRRKAEGLIADYERNGYLTPEQFACLHQLQDDQTLPDQMRKILDNFSSARTDPPTEIPENMSARSKSHA
jgi:hypothetical protein